jgi:hypothetical protein
MISAQPNKRTQETLIERLMELPNSAVSYPLLTFGTS